MSGRAFVWELDLREGIDFAIYLQGGFEPAALAGGVGVVKPGSVALDIGANIGSHTLPLAQIVGPWAVSIPSNPPTTRSKNSSAIFL